MTRSNPRLVRWLEAVAGLGLVALGVVITLRPFASWTVLMLLIAAAMLMTGVAEVLEARRARSWTGLATALAWIAGGAAVLVWPGVTIQVVTVAVGLAMLLGGAVRLWTGVRGRSAERFVAVVGGAASAVFGALALAWPDVTVLVVAVVFGARTVLHGATLVAGAVRAEPADDDGASDLVGAEPGPGIAGDGAGTRQGRDIRARGAARAVGAVLGLVLALALLAASIAIHRAGPEVDAFYDPPADVPDAPGALLRAEPFTRGMPEGSTAWRILYTTTVADGQPAVASGIVAIGAGAAEPVPVVAWAHGTTGVARECAPSLMDEPLGGDAVPALGGALDAGWAVVATDYVGMGTAGPHPYLIGEASGRAVLDAVRAARELDGSTLSDATVVWGHSQGGGAALWTGQLAPGYAPDVPLAGIVAQAPASDLPGFADGLDAMPGGSIFESFVITAYSQTYPDVRLEDYVRPGALVMVRRAADRCLSDPATFASLAASLGMRGSILARPVSEGPLAERLAENTPREPATAPLLVGQGGTDPVIPFAVQSAYVEALCAAGQEVQFEPYPGLDHMGLIGPDSPFVPEVLAWTADRFAGVAFEGGC